MNKPFLIIGALVVAVVLFFGGAYYAAVGGPLPAGIRPAPRVNTVAGTVVSRNATSLTISLQSGGTQMVPLSSDTRVIEAQAPILKKPADLTAGANVLVVFGQDASAQTIQLFPTNN